VTDRHTDGQTQPQHVLC